MPDLTSNGMQCNEFDLLLSDALDGVLSGSGLDRFQAHAKVCKVCGPLLAEAEAGRNWLKGLTEVEPPDSLVNNILASTTGVDTQRLRVPVRSPQPRISWWEHLQASLLEPIWATVRQPRFAMSFGMAFFSISMALNIAGVKLTDLRHVDLRPRAVVRQYHMTTGRVVKYYENIRFVYEIESRVRDFKRATTPAEPAPQPEQRRKDNNTSQQPERQQRNYSRGDNQPILASAPNAPPVVIASTTRRFV